MTIANSATPSMSAAKMMRARLDAAGHLRLTRHAFHRLAADAADADARADDGEAGADAGAEHAPTRPRIRLVERTRWPRP